MVLAAKINFYRVLVVVAIPFNQPDFPPSKRKEVRLGVDINNGQ